MKKIIILLFPIILFSCGPKNEVTRIEANRILKNKTNPILSQCKIKPSGIDYKIGTYGGTWNSVISSDPTTFNTVRVNDSTTSSLLGLTQPYLYDYNQKTHEWEGNIVDYEIVTDVENDTLEVICTLKDNLFWYVKKTDKLIPITSADPIFWYEEIIKFKELQMAEYSGTSIELADGTIEEVKAIAIDDKTFKFRFPRIIAEPLLSSNMTFGPKFIYEKAKEDGYEAILNLFTVDSDVQEIPTAGPFYIDSYKQGVGLTFKRNPHYYKVDEEGNKLPYIDSLNIRFIANPSTSYLLFKKGEIESLSSSGTILDGALRIEDLDELVNGAGESYDVINGGPSLGASFIVWNQNPNNIDQKFYHWFSNKKFRQAMSCFFDRDKIIENVSRGLVSPMDHFFSRASEYYNEDIKCNYLYNPEKGLNLLKSIGMVHSDDGRLIDKDGNFVEFDLSIRSESSTTVDIANIYADELKKYGIKLNVRVIDFNKMVNSLLTTYDWHSMIMGLSGSNTFPTQGSNVWQSSGNLHMWYPLQEKPVTEWEARIDYLYNTGAYTVEKDKAKIIWDEYQSIILEEMPIMYLNNSNLFCAINNKWDNIEFDYLQSGVDIERVFLR